jgi:phosphate transport system permease protein
MTPEMQSAYTGRKLAGKVAELGASTAVGLALLPLVAIFTYVVREGLSSFSLAFFTRESGIGMANAMVGTIELVVLASALAIPLGVAAGLFLAEYARTRLARLVRFATDVLAGVPSILVGVAVYAIVIVRMKHFSALAGACSLAIVMLPLIVRTTDVLARAVPESLREAALALGAPRWRTAIFVVLRTAAPGIQSGCMLAVARACGETAPLLFIGYASATLQVQIFTYTKTPNQDWHAQAWASAVVLVAIVVLLNLVARRFARVT